jgi:hypothetical protein
VGSDSEIEELSPSKSSPKNTPSPFKSVGFGTGSSPVKGNKMTGEENERSPSPAKSFSEYEVPILKNQS